MLVPKIRMAFIVNAILFAAPFEIIYTAIINNVISNLIHIIASDTGILISERVKLMLEFVLAHIVSGIGDCARLYGGRVDGENEEFFVLQFINSILGGHGDAR